MLFLLLMLGLAAPQYAVTVASERGLVSYDLLGLHKRVPQRSGRWSGVAIDPTRRELFLLHGNDLNVYSLDGGARLRSLDLARGLFRPRLTYDAIHHELWVYGQAQLRCSPQNGGAVRTVTLPLRGLDGVQSLVIDSEHDEVSVAVSKWRHGQLDFEVRTGSRLVSGTFHPLRTLRLNVPQIYLASHDVGRSQVMLAVDGLHGELIAASTGLIQVFERGASGRARPLRSWQQGLSVIDALGVEPHSGTIVVASEQSLRFYSRAGTVRILPEGMRFPSGLCLW